MRPALRLPLAILLVVLLGASAAEAQNITGTLRGTVRDQTAAALPGVSVTASNEATNLKRTVMTNATGTYAIPLLPPGRYSLRVELQGFKHENLGGIVLQIDGQIVVNVTMQLGSLGEEIDVTAEASLTNVIDASIGDVMENKRIVELPLNGRNFQQLAVLAAGTSIGQEGGTQDFFGTAGGSVGFVVNGGRDDQNNFSIDGIGAIDHYFNSATITPSVDAIQEFKVQQTTYSAESGMFGAAQVNLTTKSGTNAIHGSAYEFHRNDAFDAKNFFDLQDRNKPRFRQNNFGFSLGGPLRQNRTFFFVSYEGLRLRKDETVRSALFTAAERQGIFQGRLNDPDPGSPFPFVYDAATNTTRIPPQRFGPVARNMIPRFFPVPTFPNQTGLNNVSVAERTEDRDQIIVRVDHEISQKHRLFARYIWARADQSFPFGDNILTFDPPPPPGFPTPVTDDSQNGAVGLTSQISSNLLNELRVGFNYYDGKRGAGNQVNFAREVLGLNVDIAARDQGYPAFHLATISQFGDSDVFNPLFRTNKTFQVTDNMVWTKGRHSLKYGFDVRFVGFDTVSNFFTRGFPNFDTFPVTGNFRADFLIDRPFAIVRLKGDTEGHFNTNLWGVYINDEWRVTPRLSVSAGVRYEVFPAIKERDNRLAAYDAATQSIIVAGSQLPPEVTAQNGFARQYNALLGFFGLPPLSFVTSDSLGLGRAITKTDWGNVAPRVGFSYQLREEGKTTLRGGFGIFNALRDWSGSSDSRNLVPFTAQIVLVDLARFGVPIPPITYADMYNTIGNVPALGGIGPTVDMPIGYFMQYTTSVEHELAKNWVLSVSYIGTKGKNLNRLGTSNQEVIAPNAVPGVLLGARPDPRLGFLIQEKSGADSTYNGGVLRIEKRFSGGLGFVASYTLSKSTDTVSSARENGGAPTREQDAYDLEGERGPSNFDTRHRFSGSFTWDLPFGPGRKWGSDAQGFWGGLIGHWQLGGILTFQSGQAFTPQYPGGADPGNRFPRPSQDRDANLSSGDRDPQHWFDTAPFLAPPPIPGTTGAFPGNAGRNSLIGPDVRSVDLSLLKMIGIGRTNLQLRIESFNLFNHPNFNLPDRVFVPGADRRNANPNFGVITSARSPRVIQLGLKWLF